MKFLSILALSLSVLFSSNVFSQLTSTLNAPGQNLKRLLGLKLEMGSSTTRDTNNEIQGNQTYYQLEPSFKVTKLFNIRTGFQYTTREASGTLKGEEKANRDHFETMYVKLNYKFSKLQDNGIADFRLQGRFHSDQDDFFKRRYGADGNYQVRLYFGRPIYGNWVLNKYVTYVRYQNYFNNKYANDYTRDFDYRIRLAPTYMFSKNFSLGITPTYNHIFKVNKLNDEETLNLDLSVRYAYNNSAILFIAGAPYLSNNGGTTSFKYNNLANETLAYSITLTSFL